MLNETIIVKMYQNNTIRQIAEQFQCGYETIRKILKKNKVIWKRKYICDFNEDNIKDIANQYQNGIKIKQISFQYKISAPAISRILQANSIQIRSSKYKYETLRQIPITDIQKQFIVGTLLGDGCLYQDNKRSNYKLSFGQCDKQKEYFDWKIDIMKPFIPCFRRSIDKRGNSIMWQCSSISHPDFNQFGDTFYDADRTKIIPFDLERYLTPLALATWIMDDGSLNAYVNMRICTMSFTEQEHYRLQAHLKNKFNLESKVMGLDNRLYLSLNKENTQKLSHIIRLHIVPCMSYKIIK